LLVHDRGLDDSGWRARKVEPAKIAFDIFEMFQKLGCRNRWADSVVKWAQGSGMSSFDGLKRERLLAFLPRIDSWDGFAEKSNMLISCIGNLVPWESISSTGRKLICNIIQDVPMRGNGVWKNLVGEYLRGDLHKEEIKTYASRAMRECRAIKKLLASRVVRADMNERSAKRLAERQTFKKSHGFSIIWSRQAERTACAISATFME
jgi:hypothetical protein